MDDYNIGSEDIGNIRRAAPLIRENRDRIADFHYSRLLSNADTARFFKDEKILAKARNAFTDWLTDLVSAEYTASYYLKLDRIGGTHVRIGLPTHQVNIQISQVRNFIADLIREEYSDDAETASRLSNSISKMLDLNLDLMTRSFMEEELKSNFLSYKLDSWIIRAAKWFVNGFNMVLVAGLLFTGVMVVTLCFVDFSQIVDGDLDRGVLGALGSLLILWVVIELLDTQIGHIKGHSFAIKVFVSVALVAELRKVLMSSIGHATWQDQMTLIISVLVLGMIYWLISRVEPH